MKLLDLFCCEGGAAVGYARAGFIVHGVDINAKRHYPYPLHVEDALNFATRYGSNYDAIHASPPCQRYSITNAARKADYPDLVAATRDGLVAVGVPYVIENVVGAPLRDSLTLCWSHFYAPGSVLDDDGTPLRMERHRLFESNVPLFAAGSCRHPKDVQVAGSYGGARRDKIEAREVRRGGYVPAKHVQEQLLGIDWMTQHGLYQSLPPVYTQFIGEQLLERIEHDRL